MLRTRQNRVTPDPATPELSVMMVVGGETRFRARAGFDWINTTWKDSGSGMTNVRDLADNNPFGIALGKGLC